MQIQSFKSGSQNNIFNFTFSKNYKSKYRLTRIDDNIEKTEVENLDYSKRNKKI